MFQVSLLKFYSNEKDKHYLSPSSGLSGRDEFYGMARKQAEPGLQVLFSDYGYFCGCNSATPLCTNQKNEIPQQAKRK